MSNGLNKVMLLGNLTADAELRNTSGGNSVLSVRLATNESYLDRNKQRQERVEYHSISVWGKRGEALARLLSKGTRVFVEGSLRTSSYEKNGEKRYKTEIVASEVILCGGGQRDAAQTQNSAPYPESDYGEPDNSDLPF